MSDSVAEEANAGGAAQTAKDLFAGAAGGVAQVLLGKDL
jgi:solute carrier family 25 carnitine/acylcarnitine transporter 20/29